MSSAQATGANVVIANAGATKCASCHRAHTAKAEYLLKQAQPQLCYTCHAAGAGATTDVANGIEDGTGAALRGGGFNTAAIGSGLATKVQGTKGTETVPALALPVATTSRHEINGTTAGTAWGNGANGSGVGTSLTLECGSCHDPHGNGNYRILRPIPVDSGYAVHEIKAAIPAVVDDPLTTTVDETAAAVPAVMSPTTGIKIPDSTNPSYTTTNYWKSEDPSVPADAAATLTGTKKTTDLPLTGPVDGYINNVANWCTTCHTRYLAPSQSFKTPSGDPTFMYRHRSDANYKAGAANCITCHVSHGSNATMAAASVGLLPTDAPAPAGDSHLLRVNNRGTCVMCHNV